MGAALTRGERATVNYLSSLLAAIAVGVVIAIPFALLAAARSTLRFIIHSYRAGQSVQLKFAWVVFKIDFEQACWLSVAVLPWFTVGGLVWFLAFKDKKWRMVFMPAFIWPERLAEMPSMLTRFGRVLHWLFVLFAALSLVIGVAVFWSSWEYQSKQRQEQIAWDVRYPMPNKPGYVRSSTTDEFGDVISRPAIPDDDYSGVIVGLAAAFVLLLIGRGIRYVLAAE